MISFNYYKVLDKAFLPCIVSHTSLVTRFFIFSQLLVLFHFWLLMTREVGELRPFMEQNVGDPLMMRFGH